MVVIDTIYFKVMRPEACGGYEGEEKGEKFSHNYNDLIVIICVEQLRCKGTKKFAYTQVNEHFL